MVEFSIMDTKISLRLKHFIIALAAFALWFILSFLFNFVFYIAALYLHADVFFSTDEMGNVILNDNYFPTLNGETILGILYMFGVFIELDKLILPIFPLILALLGRRFAKENGSELSLFTAAFTIYIVFFVIMNLLAATSATVAEFWGAPFDLGTFAWIAGVVIIFGLIYPWMIIFTKPEKEKIIESTTYSLIFAFATTIVIYLIESIAKITLFLSVFGDSGYTMAYIFVMKFVLAFAVIYYFRGRRMGAIAAVFALMYLFNGMISSKWEGLILDMPDLAASLILRAVEISILFLLCKYYAPEKKTEAISPS